MASDWDQWRTTLGEQMLSAQSVPGLSMDSPKPRHIVIGSYDPDVDVNTLPYIDFEVSVTRVYLGPPLIKKELHMDWVEQVAWIIDPDAFSEATRKVEEETRRIEERVGKTSTVVTNWTNRRELALRKARRIINFINEAS